MDVSSWSLSVPEKMIAQSTALFNKRIPQATTKVLWNKSKFAETEQIFLVADLRCKYSTFHCLYVYQMFSLMHDWSKHVNDQIFPREVIQGYSPILKTTLIDKNIWRIINTIASTWHENILLFLSLDIISSSKFSERKTVCSSEQEYPSIFLR